MIDLHMYDSYGYSVEVLFSEDSLVSLGFLGTDDDNCHSYVQLSLREVSGIYCFLKSLLNETDVQQEVIFYQSPGIRDLPNLRMSSRESGTFLVMEVRDLDYGVDVDFDREDVCVLVENLDEWLERCQNG